MPSLIFRKRKFRFWKPTGPLEKQRIQSRPRFFCFLSLGLSVLIGCGLANNSVRAEPSRSGQKNRSFANNPLFSGADPDIIKVGDTYWVYPTETGVGHEFFAYSSIDLKNWKRHGPVLDLLKVKWINDDGAKEHDAWAPGIFQNKGKYYLYYSVGPQNPTPSRIGVAVSNSPDGTFVDSGKPLLTGGNGFEAIDAMVFHDPKSGKNFLYCGGSAGSKLRVFELSSDLTSLAREIAVPTPKGFTEGAFMHERNGIYYLSFSSGKWDTDSYSVRYSCSNSPTGPWTDKGVILQTNLRHAGPGHHAFLRDTNADGKESWFVIYHRWNDAKRIGKMPPLRSIAVEPIRYLSNNDIAPIEMSDKKSKWVK